MATGEDGLRKTTFEMWDLFDCEHCDWGMGIALVQVTARRDPEFGAPIAECRRCGTTYRVGVQLVEYKEQGDEPL